MRPAGACRAATVPLAHTRPVLPGPKRPAKSLIRWSGMRCGMDIAPSLRMKPRMKLRIQSPRPHRATLRPTWLATACLALGAQAACAVETAPRSWNDIVNADPAAALSLANAVHSKHALQQPRGATSSAQPQPTPSGAAHSSVPEPGTAATMMVGLAALALALARQRFNRVAAAVWPRQPRPAGCATKPHRPAPAPMDA